VTLSLVYLGLITLAELLTATIGSGTDFIYVGLSLHSLILVVLILQGARPAIPKTGESANKFANCFPAVLA
jgi:hypothetical protein